MRCTLHFARPGGGGQCVGKAGEARRGEQVEEGRGWRWRWGWGRGRASGRGSDEKGRQIRMRAMAATSRSRAALTDAKTRDAGPPSPPTVLLLAIADSNPAGLGTPLVLVLDVPGGFFNLFGLPWPCPGPRAPSRARAVSLHTSTASGERDQAGPHSPLAPGPCVRPSRRPGQSIKARDCLHWHSTAAPSPALPCPALAATPSPARPSDAHHLHLHLAEIHKGGSWSSFPSPRPPTRKERYRYISTPPPACLAFLCYCLTPRRPAWTPTAHSQPPTAPAVHIRISASSCTYCCRHTRLCQRRYRTGQDRTVPLPAYDATATACVPHRTAHPGKVPRLQRERSQQQQQQQHCSRPGHILLCPLRLSPPPGIYLPVAPSIGVRGGLQKRRREDRKP